MSTGNELPRNRPTAAPFELLAGISCLLKRPSDSFIVAADSPRPKPIPGRVWTARFACPRPWTVLGKSLARTAHFRGLFADSADARPAARSTWRLPVRCLPSTSNNFTSASRVDANTARCSPMTRNCSAHTSLAPAPAPLPSKPCRPRHFANRNIIERILQWAERVAELVRLNGDSTEQRQISTSNLLSRREGINAYGTNPRISVR
jgi:hypothetical protein